MTLSDFVLRLNAEITNFLNTLSEQKLKIAIISYYFEPPITSGVGIHSRHLARYLAKANCEVHVFCSNSDGESYRKDNVIVHNIGRTLANLNGSLPKKRLEYFLFESEVVKAVIRENSKQEFDIIHTQGSLTKAAFILKKICGLKWVHTFHAIEKARVRKLSLEEKHFEDLITWGESTVNYCDGAIYVSNPVYAQGRRLYSIKKKIVIPNGVDTEIFRHSAIKGKNVLFIGRFSKEKGIELFPEIIERIMKIDGATMTILAPCNALPKDMVGIHDRICSYEKQYKGRLRVIRKSADQDSIAELYRRCQVYIQPSKYESFGLCILEAMSTGRPVVAFRVGGIPELLGDCGYAVDSKEEFIRKIEELLDDRALCRQIGDRARERAEKFKWEIVAGKTLGFYREVLNE